MSYRIEKLDPERFLVWDVLRETDPYYLNHHLFDVDFSRIGEDIQRKLREGKPLYSYLSYVLQGYGRCLARFPRMNSYLRLWPVTRLAVYDGVDIAVPIERTWNGRSIVLLSLLRNAGELSVDEIQTFLFRRRDDPLDTLEEFAGFQKLLKIPAMFRWYLFQIFVKPFPSLLRNLVGTTAFTSIGKFGTTLTTPLSPRSCTLSLGQVEVRPRVVASGNIEARLSGWITLTYDHRIADGAEIARMGNDLRRSLETLGE